MPIETKPEPTAAQRLFDVQAAAGYLKSLGATATTVNFVRSLIASGQVPHVKMGKRFYVSKASLDDWIAKAERRSKL